MDARYPFDANGNLLSHLEVVDGRIAPKAGHELVVEEPAAEPAIEPGHYPVDPAGNSVVPPAEPLSPEPAAAPAADDSVTPH